ncbi:MAG: hypothetical protein O3A06_05805 [Proteobacteria bacterium]|nr:hypothetical protein [Pseudomonadota bacterium]MDA0982535.1 hypothetical protein [Pseudomonadota bacterium]
MSLRGDYNLAAFDFSVGQDWGAYRGAEHVLYRRLYERQSKLVARTACTEWIIAVPGLIPDEAFFTHLANRRFPVTVWLRKPEEFDYIVEPDVFHDFFGHVPLLFDPVYADHLHEYSKGGLKAMRLDFDLERALRTHYQIDHYQTTYFVIDSFAQLMCATAPDFAPIYVKLPFLPVLEP